MNGRKLLLVFGVLFMLMGAFGFDPFGKINEFMAGVALAFASNL